MKRILEYRRLFAVEKSTDLKELKTAYRNLMKEWHPDKFQDDSKKLEAEEKSKTLIEAYSFLVSIAPETIELNLADYNKTLASSNLIDYKYKASVLQVDFSDGSSYEYFGVPVSLYKKLINSDIPGRFVRRNVCNEFTYRKIGKSSVE